MPDTKITALTAIGANPIIPSTFPIPMVDLTDTSMAASGTTKKVTVNQILGAGGTATLASATITGDLTARNWFVTGGSLPGVGNSNPFAYRIGGGGLGIGAATETGTTAPIVFYAGQGGVEQYRIAPLGVNTWSDGAGGTRMTLNATGLGVGAVPSNYRLYVSAAFASGLNGAYIECGEFNKKSLVVNHTNASVAANLFEVQKTGTAQFLVDSSGNVGIGVAPITSHILSCSGPVGITGTLAGTRTSYITNASAASIYYTDGGGSGYFTDFGNLIIQPRTSAARSVVIATGSTTPVERAVVKSTGQVRFVPLAADPAGAEAGDVYYNSTSNKLKCYNGTTWNDLF